jgi:HAD superfamily hydrolase (TIGR01509 family)
MAAPNAVLFDLDGTVWDSRPFFADAAAARTGDRPGAVARLIAGVSAARVLRDAGVTKAGFRAIFSRAQPQLYPAARKTLAALHDTGIPMGVATSLPGWLAEPMLAAIGLEEHFTVVVTYGDTKRRKPNPEPLLLCCERLGVKPSAETWYVGDAASDGAAACAAGLSFAWASWGYEAFEPPGVGRRLSRFSDVAGL